MGHTEAEHEQALQRAQRAEARADREAHQREESELQWQQRHGALQRQLRRTEVALGDATLSRARQPAAHGTSVPGDEIDVNDRQAARILADKCPSIDAVGAMALVEDAQRESLGSSAILELL